MISVYRIRHVPSGLYFCPSREVKVKLQDDVSWQASGRYVKSNLSVKGKAYTKKPSLTFLGSLYYTHLITKVSELNSHSRNACLVPVVPSEWQIEEVSTHAAPIIGTDASHD